MSRSPRWTLATAKICSTTYFGAATRVERGPAWSLGACFCEAYFAGTLAGGRTGRSVGTTPVGSLEVSALAGVSLAAALAAFLGCALPAARLALAGGVSTDCRYVVRICAVCALDV